ncbi:UDP-glucose flavonoid 3-O-glucosyltransferase 6 [Heracleum sosnowskyi]|uniref:Glycosyltransferase n=1 Tax=Heracleum sosnowskyi TaxID=360622 RepID=A0AAD8J2H2_9APIA|nr:UDP-glucose flavonoid 3-O-glucosyltransferase 6 [Heracleum sosnowskyi]
MKNAELIFVPAPARGHLISMVELAKLFINRNESLSVTIFIIKFPYDTGISSYVESLSNNPIPRFTIIEIPPSNSETYKSQTHHTILSTFIEGHVTNVKDKVIPMTQPDYPTQLAGFVIDIFCVSMIDMAKELNIPSYVYLTSGAGFLSIMLHLQALTDYQKKDISKYDNSDAQLFVPCFRNQVPAKVLPSICVDKEGSQLMLLCGRKFRETKGLIVNTFVELETYAVESLMADNKIPPVYAVGPNLNLTTGDEDYDEAADILKWLDEKPLSSVVYLCFGSFGSFPEDQVKEIALALEHSGHPFLWSLRPVATDNHLNKYTNLDDILPPGFLERTSGIGKIIGWAPQVAVLSHHAVGGFVSHCGWNSLLESVWYGVPVATWPLYAEQQLNAFEMVNELGMAVDICIDYEHHAFFKGEAKIIESKTVESKIRELMKDGSNIRKKVTEIKRKSRDAMAENGSSYNNLGRDPSGTTLMYVTE